MTIFSEVNNLRGRRGDVEGTSLGRYKARIGLWFISPWIIGFLAFILLPMVASFVFTFFDFNITQPDEIEFVGFENYQKLLRDPDLQTSIVVTLRFAALALPLAIIQPILMATLLNSDKLWAKQLFTTLFYMPFIIPLISAIYIWQGVMNAETGWINRFLELIGLEGPNWLNDPDWIVAALIIIGLWGAGNAMLLTLAAMQNIPTELYEAARVDGATGFRIFFNITIPLVTPVIFYNLVLATIGLFQYFTVPYVLSQGGRNDPDNAMLFYNIHFYKTTFRFQDMGYGATLAWLLFVIVLILTIALFYSAKYWVYQPGGTD